MSEAELQMAVADYIRMQYPNVLFHSDFGSGVKLTMGQAAKQKRMNGGRRAWPDMFIELKKAGTRIVKSRKPDEWASDHIAEQARLLSELRSKGYAAAFAVGFDEAKEIIDNYLEGGGNYGK